MHELSFVSAALNTVLHATPQDRVCRVLSVEIAIGVFSSYVEEAIRLHWDRLSLNTEAESARLIFYRLPGKLKCLSCQRQFPAENRYACCPSCGGVWTIPVTGEDCRVEAIEIEDALVESLL